MEQAELLKLSEAVAGHLSTRDGKAWRVIPPRENAPFSSVQLTDGECIVAISESYYEKGRLAISGTGPKGSDGRTVSLFDYTSTWAKDEWRKITPSISVGERRPAEAIAKEVVRRFLPHYRALFAYAKECVAKRENGVDNANGIIARLAAVVSEEDVTPIKEEESSRRNMACFTHYTGGGTNGVRVHVDVATYRSENAGKQTGPIDLNITECSEDLAAKILRLIQEETKA